ncbi:hypothetical protein [Bifidobacterium sp. SO4]|uniref:hypothetical protein n=1 Tax=Bifidobacterium sp. SO4 TaxID=2809030 RepID=UPI001BDD5155|nr:hypothetical protein [Bifidobacterium sp. SO4]
MGITSPLCVVQTIALFLLFQSAEPLLKKMPLAVVRWLKLISGASLGVYLFHILMINWIRPGRLFRILDRLSDYPFLKAVFVYVVIAVLVMAGKWIIARVKRLFL